MNRASGRTSRAGSDVAGTGSLPCPRAQSSWQEPTGLQHISAPQMCLHRCQLQQPLPARRILTLGPPCSHLVRVKPGADLGKGSLCEQALPPPLPALHPPSLLAPCSPRINTAKNSRVKSCEECGGCCSRLKLPPSSSSSCGLACALLWGEGVLVTPPSSFGGGKAWHRSQNTAGEGREPQPVNVRRNMHPGPGWPISVPGLEWGGRHQGLTLQSENPGSAPPPNKCPQVLLGLTHLLGQGWKVKRGCMGRG